MIIILSPSKNMDLATALPVSSNTQSQFLAETCSIAEQVKNLTLPELKSCLKVSDKLAELNYERYQNWKKQHSAENSRPAIFTFKGDAYLGLDAFSLSQTELEFAQKHLRVLSGFYGILRPLDLIQPYRLEMGGKFSPKESKNLYSFWQEKITDSVNSELQSSKLLINLASTEYSSVIDLKKLDAKVITPQFLDQKNGNYKIVSSFAKKARGMMTRWIIQNRIKSSEKLSTFCEAGYQFCTERSTENQPVFIR